ncbi:MAG: type IV secretory system conjugative DNA transfer family protein [Planctomycetaceae bacterium]|nr:type IV secretory system conjugative DNA transfer family protein [Planctomycetaceae bacterium]
MPRSAFDTHLHLIGGTGKGKTTALHTILQQLMDDPVDESAFFIIDRLGNFSFELLLWMASEYCPSDVRERLLYIQPSNEDVILGFNPLTYETEAHGYFKVTRTTDIILRAWEDVNIEAMPRLARWTFNSFWAMAYLGLTVSDCAHLLFPGSKHHEPLLRCLPPGLKTEWDSLLKTRSSEVERILDSTRNRLKPYLENPILNRMFGTTHNGFNVEQLMKDRRIVILDLSPRNRLDGQVADAIGGLVLNEILAVARSFPIGVRYPTYVVLDEFQNFVGPDIEHAIPEVRQLGIKLMLSHQSFSQLQRGDHDLTNLIFQAQSRLIFGVQGEDAELLASECGSLSFNPKKVKDEIYSRRQLIAGHKREKVKSMSTSQSCVDQWNKTYGESWSRKDSVSKRDGSYIETKNEGQDRGENQGRSEGQSRSETYGETEGETFLPIYDNFQELSSRTYYSFDEQRSLWAQKIRQLSRGRALLRLVDDPKLYDIDIKQMAVGYLKWPTYQLREELPEVIEEVEELIQENFASEAFTSPAVIDREREERINRVISPKVVISTETSVDAADDPFFQSTSD